jgi:hypothetical protein
MYVLFAILYILLFTISMYWSNEVISSWNKTSYSCLKIWYLNRTSLKFGILFFWDYPTMASWRDKHVHIFQHWNLSTQTFVIEVWPSIAWNGLFFLKNFQERDNSYQNELHSISLSSHLLQSSSSYEASHGYTTILQWALHYQWQIHDRGTHK